MSIAHVVPAGPPAAVRAAQALLALMGAVVTFGSVYFSVIAPPQDVAGVDWLVGAWALAMGLAGLAIAARLGSGGARVRRLALQLLLLHVVFSVVKLVAYDEPQAVTFMALDGVLLALLALPGTRAWFSRTS